jgi:hypothetical protein
MVALENGLSFFKCIARSAEVSKGLYEVEGLIALLVAVVGKEGEKLKVARENALGAIFNIADPPDVQLGLFHPLQPSPKPPPPLNRRWFSFT